MIIRKIKLENIRSHENSTVEFTDGINVIVGNTGSGKSSILMGIEYALFGKTSDNDARIILRRNTNSGKVILELEENGSIFEISRGLKRVKDSVRNDDSVNLIRKDGKPVNLFNRTEDINNYIIKNLDLDENGIKTFEAITYIKQDELKNIILESPAERQKLIDSILHLNKYQETYDYLKDLITLMEAKISALEESTKIPIDENEIIQKESKIKEAEQEIEKYKAELNNLLQLKQEIEKEKEEANKRRDVILEKEKEYKAKVESENILRKEIEEKTKELQINENRIALLSQQKHEMPAVPLEELRRKEKELMEIVSRLNSERTNLISISAGLEKEIENDEKIKADSLKKYEMLTNQINDLNQRILEAQSKLNDKNLVYKEEISGRVAQINDFIEILEKEKSIAIETGKCPICGNDANKEHIEKEYENRINELRKLAEEFRNNKADRKSVEQELLRQKTIKESLEAQIKQIEEDMNRNVEEKKEKLNNIRLEISKLENETRKSLEDLNKIKQEIDEYINAEKIIKEIETLKMSNEKIKMEIDKYQIMIKSIEEEIAALNFNKEDLDKAEQEIENILKKENEVNAKIKEDETRIELGERNLENMRKELEEIKEKLKKVKEMEAELNKIEKLYSLIVKLREDIRSIREYVRNEFLGEFSELFRDKFNELRRDSDYDLEIDNQYNIRVISGNQELSVNALSGGEKTIAALSYRIALSIIASRLAGIRQTELLIMDEPTVGLDREDLNVFMNALTKLSGIRQIIIVTHEELFKSIADKLIEIRKEAGRSIVTEI